MMTDQRSKQYFHGLTEKHGNKKGFTFVELLVCVAILAILAMAAWNIFDFGNRTMTVESSKSESTGALRTAMDLILTDIRKSGAFQSDFETDNFSGRNYLNYKHPNEFHFNGTANGGHNCIISHSDKTVSLSLDGKTTVLPGEIYGIEMIYDGNRKIDIVLYGTFVDDNGERDNLTSTYYFRE